MLFNNDINKPSNVASIVPGKVEIQNQLDRLLEYCNAWGLSVNTAKN